jgi:hypothetical protein
MTNRVIVDKRLQDCHDCQRREKPGFNFYGHLLCLCLNLAY